MKRTQLYLDEPLWAALHAQARSRKITLSEVVREALRERYLGKDDQRRAAMLAFVGIRKNKTQELSATEEVRRLRRGSRLERLLEK